MLHPKPPNPGAPQRALKLGRCSRSMPHPFLHTHTLLTSARASLMGMRFDFGCDLESPIAKLNAFILHQGCHYKTVVAKAPPASPLLSVIHSEPEYGGQVSDDDDDDDAVRPQADVQLPVWTPPTAAAFLSWLPKLDESQVLRHGLQVLWHARLSHLIHHGLHGKARSLMQPEIMNCVMAADQIAAPGQCLPPQCWAKNCRRQKQRPNPNPKTSRIVHCTPLCHQPSHVSLDRHLACV